jgi:uncharacterized protein
MAPRLLDAASRYPAVAITGPRQSGKTTLCRALFPQLEYVSLEPLDTRDFAVSDPRGFLAKVRDGAILDEVQRAPELFSYLQEEVDRDATPGRFILTGSQHFGLLDAITQSLAGRVSLLHLMPPSYDELLQFPSPPEGLWPTLWAGAYPRIHDRRLEPDEWLANYLATYVQRDVRQVLRVTDLDAFTTFLRLLAGRTAREENLRTLGADAGVSHPTVRSWLSVLEASFIIFRVPRWHRNLRKRAAKAAKIHFVDSGLACHLLGIRTPDQLEVHPLRGAVFESWVAAEILKARLHRGVPADLYHLRETRGLEIDLIAEGAQGVVAVEAKSGKTVASEVLGPLRTFRAQLEAQAPHLAPQMRLIHGGGAQRSWHGVDVLPWCHIQDVPWS